MAHIHEARNDLKTKYEQSKIPISQETLREWRIQSVLSGIFLVICAATALYAWINPEFARILIKESPVFIMDILSAVLRFIMDLFNRYPALWVIPIIGFAILWFSHLQYLYLDIFDMIRSLFFPALLVIGLFWVAVWLAVYLIPVFLIILAIRTILRDLYEPRSIETEESRILLAGLEGEKEALSLIKHLGNDCHIYTNLRIPYNGGESETDMIVVSPAGVTVIEVKNHKGLITGDASDDMLAQYKSRRSTEPTKTFHNPIYQVGTHRYRLQGYLRARGIPVSVRRCVLFVNLDAQLSMTDRQGITQEKCPVFLRKDKKILIKYVSKGAVVLSEDALQRTVSTLNALLEAGLNDPTP